MRVLRGKPVAPGYAEGWAFPYQAHRLIVPRYAIEPGAVPQEIARFAAALVRASELERLAVEALSLDDSATIAALARTHVEGVLAEKA